MNQQQMEREAAMGASEAGTSRRRRWRSACREEIDGDGFFHRISAKPSQQITDLTTPQYHSFISHTSARSEKSRSSRHLLQALRSMDSTRTRHHHHPHPKPSPLSDDATIQSSSSTLNSNHKARAARLEAQSQHKALSRSVIAESLDYFMPKGNPSLVRTVSDSRKLSHPHPHPQPQLEVGSAVAKAVKSKPNLNPEKERWRKKFYGGEIVKLIYDTSKEKTKKKAEGVNGEKQRRQQRQDVMKEEGEEDVGEVKKRVAKMEIVEVEKIKGDVMKRVAVGRRKSFSGTETSLSSFLSSNGARIVAVDMPPFMQIHAIDCARKAYDSLEKFTSKSLALSLKKEFDGVYGPAWHCIVGTSFGSFVTHSVGGFLYFSLDHKMYILLFKTTVQRAD